MLQTIADSTQTAAANTAIDYIYWPHIHPTISIVALVVGILIMFIAYIAGGRYNSSKIIFSVTCAFLIGILTVPLFIRLANVLSVSQKVGQAGILLLIILFVAMVSTHAYEVVTVSAREARPPD
ncbi:MAG TPA: hypothetical protein PKN04_10145 [bacterium]|nr:hypothetical protein [bacterium]HNT66128.1 hypothetical protein [bacterium]HOX87056.1 hypothetical protein [bacterium]HPG46387.1 hypothetical protein [bacterium]HPM98699.1 hypothetical protein [bacterium]